jgi:hypothetical protein
MLFIFIKVIFEYLFARKMQSEYYGSHFLCWLLILVKFEIIKQFQIKHAKSSFILDLVFKKYLLNRVTHIFIKFKIVGISTLFNEYHLELLIQFDRRQYIFSQITEVEKRLINHLLLFNLSSLNNLRLRENELNILTSSDRAS